MIMAVRGHNLQDHHERLPFLFLKTGLPEQLASKMPHVLVPALNHL